MAILNGIATIVAMALFFGIVWWAFSARRKKDNEQAANLPFDLPDEAMQARQNKDDEVRKP